jgi:hypothetical protein
LPNDGYGHPVDQEDYLHSIRLKVSKEYHEKADKRWKKLSEFLLYDWGYQEWYDMVWDFAIDGRTEPRNRNVEQLESVHPIFRHVLSTILTTINGIHRYADMDEMHLDILSKRAMDIHPNTGLTDEDIETNFPEFNELWKQLPVYFRWPNWMSGINYAITLPKAEKLVRYVAHNPEFRRILQALYNLHEDNPRYQYQKSKQNY